ASGELTRKSTKASAASGSWALAEIDQYMEALYHSWASAAEPVIEGGRSTVMPPGTAASWATTWLDQATVMPMRSVANRDWSSDWAASSTEVEASGPAPVSSMRWAYSIREVAASASKPTPPSRYWSCPSCRIHTWNNAWIVAIWVMASVLSSVFSEISVVMSIRSSQVQVVSSGSSTPASSNTAGLTRKTAALSPALIAIRPSSASSPTSTAPSAKSEVSSPASARSSRAPRPPYSLMYFSSIWMTSGRSPPAVWVASLSQ